jgi:hypothetical protein
MPDGFSLFRSIWRKRRPTLVSSFGLAHKSRWLLGYCRHDSSTQNDQSSGRDGNEARAGAKFFKNNRRSGRSGVPQPLLMANTEHLPMRLISLLGYRTLSHYRLGLVETSCDGNARLRIYTYLD